MNKPNFDKVKKIYQSYRSLKSTSFIVRQVFSFSKDVQQRKVIADAVDGITTIVSAAVVLCAFFYMMFAADVNLGYDWTVTEIVLIVAVLYTIYKMVSYVPKFLLLIPMTFIVWQRKRMSGFYVGMYGIGIIGFEFMLGQLLSILIALR